LFDLNSPSHSAFAAFPDADCLPIEDARHHTSLTPTDSAILLLREGGSDAFHEFRSMRFFGFGSGSVGGVFF
jgi:hypothetical protein|tara:strand:+ start:116 stop:331 length:216 start_codon:yes stop_codon:yes gene_type:complete